MVGDKIEDVYNHGNLIKHISSWPYYEVRTYD